MKRYLSIIGLFLVLFFTLNYFGLYAKKISPLIFIFGIFIFIFCLFLTDAISQLFSGIPNRQVFYNYAYYYKESNIFIIYNIIGKLIPLTILLILMKWYFAYPLFFISIEIVFFFSKRLFDNNINIFKIIILHPKFFRNIVFLLFGLFIYLII